MAKTLLLARPHMAALCPQRTHFFSFLGHRCFQFRALIRPLILPVHKLGHYPLTLTGFGTKPMSPHIVGPRSFATRVTSQFNGSGSIDSSVIQSMEKKIKEQLNAESVTVRDAYGDARHVSIDVVSSAFEGQSSVNRQRMVYKAIWEELQDIVHAVDQMTTRTPIEVASGSEKAC